ncbi:Phosphoesterase [Penicillium soppii]|uniref:Phosphoesterase n=1 Tax=Penicillium soppii TaxID=69789 RepID=UPI0025499475|nr:Phosphoesterase [Penicillium soppii]KAJ5861548.1 Phosphoesterase [Penicillium soppii]
MLRCAAPNTGTIRWFTFCSILVLIIKSDKHGRFLGHVPTPIIVPQSEDGIVFKGKSSSHLLRITSPAWEYGMSFNFFQACDEPSSLRS